MALMRPAETDYDPYYAPYLALVEEEDVLEAIEQQSYQTQKLLSCVEEARGAHRYAEGKWSIKELMGHVCDAERVFGYRLMAVGRGEVRSLPGFDENSYVASGAFDEWKLADLVEQYAHLRRANLLLLRNLPEEAWNRRGVANEKPVTARALAWILVGHERHHMKVLREKYGVGA